MRSQLTRDLVAVTILFMSGTHTLLAQTLNRLNSCSDLSRIQLWIEKEAASSSCKRPHGTIDRTIESRSRTIYPAQRLCFADPPDTNVLDGFSCVVASGEGQRSLTCYREISSTSIEQYKSNYKELQQSVSRYLSEASECKVSSGDVSIDPVMMPPPYVALVARSEFAFRSVVGVRGGKETSSIIHGFTTLDPTVPGSRLGGLEFLTFHSAGRSFDIYKGEISRFGNITVHESDGGEFAETFTKQFPRQVPVQVAIRSFDLKRRPLSGGATEEDRKIPARMRKAVSRFIRLEGLRKVTDDQFKAVAGDAPEELLRRFQGNLPYGLRDPLKDAFEQEFSMFVDDSPSSCPGNGALVFMVSSSHRKERTLDLGDMEIMGMSLGECARSTSGRRFFRSIITKSVSIARDEISN